MDDKFPERLEKVESDYFYLNGEVVYCNQEYTIFYVHYNEFLYFYEQEKQAFLLQSATRMAIEEAQELGASLFLKEAKAREKKMGVSEIFKKVKSRFSA